VKKVYAGLFVLLISICTSLSYADEDTAWAETIEGINEMGESEHKWCDMSSKTKEENQECHESTERMMNRRRDRLIKKNKDTKEEKKTGFNEAGDKAKKKADTDYVDLALGIAGVGALEALVVEEADYHLGDLKKQWEEEEGGDDIQPLRGLDTHANATRTDRSEHTDAGTDIDIPVFHNPCAAQPRALHVRDGNELFRTLERIIAGRPVEFHAPDNRYDLQFAVLNILAGFQDTVNTVRTDENGEEILDPELMDHNTYILPGDDRPGGVIMAEYAREHAGVLRDQDATIARRRLAADEAKKAADREKADREKADRNQERAERNDTDDRTDVDETADEEKVEAVDGEGDTDEPVNELDDDSIFTDDTDDRTDVDKTADEEKVEAVDGEGEVYGNEDIDEED
jgi:hypothetical protein